MSYPAKVHLSPSEMQLVTNSEWILAKQKIIQKVFDMFGSLHLELQQEVSHSKLPEEVKQNNGKIYKGENYLNLPYVIMDYPAFFSKTDVFAVRTMFWWGNYFSITLHTSGKYKTLIGEKKDGVLPFLRQKNFYICVSDEEWEHHFEEPNYKVAADINDMNDVLKKSFFKTGKTISLTDWDNVPDLVMAYFKEIMELTLEL